MPSCAVDPALPGMPRPFDETSSDDAYVGVLEELEGRDLSALSADIAKELSDKGVCFGYGDDSQPFVVDPVPRIIAAAQWQQLERGLVQRVRALEHFVADVYGAREIVSDGVLPAKALTGASYHEPSLTGLDVETWIPIAGLDLVRDDHGRFLVLEDNVRTPSGLAYALATRRAVGQRIGVPPGRRLEPLDESVKALRDAIAALAPASVSDPHCVLLSDGARNSAFYEHETLARLLGFPLVIPDLLEQSSGRLYVRLEGRRSRVDVLYRRTNADRLFAPDGRPEPLADLLLEPWSRGHLGIANAFGTGVADDKLLHAHVHDMIDFYLGETPLLPSVTTWDLSRPGILERTLDQLDRLVVKPRDGHGGEGVVIGPLASSQELSRLARDLTRHPDRYVAQDTVVLSQHPTVADGRLSGRHVDLRPFVFTAGDEHHVVPGGLTRVALEEGSLVVNSSRRGGAKDTWVLS